MKAVNGVITFKVALEINTTLKIQNSDSFPSFFIDSCGPTNPEVITGEITLKEADSPPWISDEITDNFSGFE